MYFLFPEDFIFLPFVQVLWNMYSPRFSAPTTKTRGLMLCRDSWATALKDHQKRVRTMKPAIQIEEPWHAPRRPLSARPAANRPGSARQKSPPSAERKPGSTQKVAAKATIAAKPSTLSPIDELTPSQQAAIRDVVDILISFDTDRSKVIVEEMFKTAEEQRLLQGYTGIFPKLETEQEREQTKKS